ncbi:NAD(P)-dependent oxidoreductase [Phenylobacterium sp. LjRoot219]|uniref:NAD(P)-dependent oxidoreductase n=1 Tax=Phenylobacterium sp. LjRoot219 TaxID=3342283 RepID=UPI003ECF7BEC
MRIGWIGLGAMGLGMARCAARAGHEVTGHTRGRPEHQALVADGGRLSPDLDAVAASAEILCINVFNDEQVRGVLYDEGVLGKLQPGAMLVIHTTGAPDLSRQVQADAPAGVEVVDGAFSGSPQQAAEGALTLMVGASDAAWPRVEPLFDAYGAFVRHVGPLGAGMQLKLLNNLLFAAHVRLAADAYRIAIDQGLAVETVAEVLARSSGASRALALLGARAVPDDLSSMRKYVEKDVETALRIAAAAGLDLKSVGEVARSFAEPGAS